MMKRYLAALLSAMMMFCAVPVFAQETFKVYFESELLDGAESFVHADEAYLPIRAICESMGFEVDWDNETRSVIVGKTPETAILADEVSLYIDGENIETEIIIVNSLSYMPANDMCAAFGLEIERNDAEGVIYVTLAKSAALDGRYYRIKDEATGGYLAADYSDFENGVKIALEDKSSAESQLWGFNAAEGDSYTVFVKSLRQYITGGETIGLGRDGEKISLAENEDGSVKLISEAGLLLTIDNGFAAWKEIDDSAQQSFMLEYAGAISKGNDTFGTTFGAHDPAIFKDPKTGIYYAYNTDAYNGKYETADGEIALDDYPMDTFRSADLINWERIDNNFRIPQSAIDFCEEIFAPMGSAMNQGIWAPDIFYAEEDTEHPYWLYYSLSTNGTDFDYIRSLVGLVKGESPTGPWVDCGVVISSDETGSFTNAIDQNIYEDTDGTRFFIWGSFQKGIFQVKRI